jgi:MATE family multidrug resistance protein
VGCAWATLVVNCSMLALACGCCAPRSIYAPCALARMERPHWPTIRLCPRLGVPAGLAILVEVTSFTLMALFIARQGTTLPPQHTRSRPTWPPCCTWCRCRWPSPPVRG